MHNSESAGGNETQNLQEFCDTNESPNLGQTTRPWECQQKRKELVE